MYSFRYCTCSVWTTISLSVYLSVLAASVSLQRLTTPSFCPEALLCFDCYTVSHRLASMGVRSAATCLGEHTISPTTSLTMDYFLPSFPSCLLFVFTASLSRYVSHPFVASSMQQSCALFDHVRVLASFASCFFSELFSCAHGCICFVFFRSSILSGCVLCPRTRYVSAWLTYIDLCTIFDLLLTTQYVSPVVGPRIRTDTGCSADVRCQVEISV